MGDIGTLNSITPEMAKNIACIYVNPHKLTCHEVSDAMQHNSLAKSYLLDNQPENCPQAILELTKKLLSNMGYTADILADALPASNKVLKDTRLIFDLLPGYMRDQLRDSDITLIVASNLGDYALSKDNIDCSGIYVSNHNKGNIIGLNEYVTTIYPFSAQKILLEEVIHFFDEQLGFSKREGFKNAVDQMLDVLQKDVAKTRDFHDSWRRLYEHYYYYPTTTCSQTSIGGRMDFCSASKAPIEEYKKRGQHYQEMLATYFIARNSVAKNILISMPSCDIDLNNPKKLFKAIERVINDTSQKDAIRDTMIAEYHFTPDLCSMCETFEEGLKQRATHISQTRVTR